MGKRVGSYIVFFLVIIGILTIFSGCVEEKSSPTKVPQDIYEIIDSIEPKTNVKLPPLFGELEQIIINDEQRLADDPTDLWTRLDLAFVYQKTFQYRKALGHYIKATQQAPDKADPFIGLGMLYYDLAMTDYYSRNLKNSSPITGLIEYHPDEKTKKILKLAKEMLLISKEKERLIRSDENGANLFSFPPVTADEFLDMINSKLQTGYIGDTLTNGEVSVWLTDFKLGDYEPYYGYNIYMNLHVRNEGTHVKKIWVIRTYVIGAEGGSESREVIYRKDIPVISLGPGESTSFYNSYLGKLMTPNPNKVAIRFFFDWNDYNEKYYGVDPSIMIPM
ncbi:MAG: hypothetical protein O8C62_06110 [Candidatus Methanoperedens sp.]|nr:hypothetical protein [Candidatus Methanoperedens sp.]